MKALGVAVCVALVCVLAAVIYSAIGYGFAWVLSFFGVQVPWYVCAVGAWLVSLLVNSGVRK